jgi:hypothetical protein
VRIITKIATSSAIGLGGALLIAMPASALVQTADIANGAVTSAKIANGTIATKDIAANAIRTSQIVNGGVQSVDISNGTILGEDLNPAIEIASDVTRATGATGSFQNLAGDVTYQGAAGGTSSFHAGVMGHFHGSTLTNSAASYHAGVIGAYSVATSDASTGAKAGVVGAVGVDGDASTAASAAVMAVLDGGVPGATITANAAYGVQYLNATTAAKFSYGLDLSHAAASPYPAVSYGTADIRLAVGTTIGSGLTGSRPATCVKGSLYLNTTTGIPDVCTATDTWTALDLTD